MESNIIDNLCFVIMPFAKEFKNQWKVAIAPAIEECGLTPWRGDEDRLGTNIIIRDVTRSIADSKLVVADVTGKNPNVMYELGLAHAAKKNVIMLINDDQAIPFDIGHVRCVKYDPLDLIALRDNLINRINHSLALPVEKIDDLFPELQIMSKETERELEYLREKSRSIKVSVYPPVADIFFNNAFIGTGNATIRVNMDAKLNTLSFISSNYYEYYLDMRGVNISNDEISVTLDPRIKEDLSKRVPKWLRYRRKDPDNPVLMRAISAYLCSIKEYEEALEEAKELLKIAPGWYLAHNLYGFVLAESGRVEESDKYFRRTVALNSYHYLGYYNIACNASLNKDYKECILQIENIANDKERLASYFYGPGDLFETDNSFDNIRESNEFGTQFKKLTEEISASRVQYVHPNK